MYRLRITGDLGFEFWQDIPGYERKYQASTYGRIKSVKESIMSPYITKNGYKRITLYSEGIKKNKYIHVLISETFLPNYENKDNQVNHRDEDKTNNNIWNLERCDCRYNLTYGTCTARRVASKSKKILQYDLNGNLIATYQSAVEAKRKTGFDDSSIGKCCKNKENYNTAYGYIWKYA